MHHHTLPYDYRWISIKDIDLNDEQYRISTDEPDRALISSIKELGILSVPILVAAAGYDQERPQASEIPAYTIVSGFRRIRASMAIARYDIHAAILDANTRGMTCARIAVAENSFQRNLNPVECSRGIQLLSTLCHENELITECINLRLANSPSHVKKLKPVFHYPKPLQAGLLSERIALPIVAVLAGIEPEQRDVYTELFNSLKMSLGKQREIIALSKDILLREKISISDLFNSQDIREIIDSEHMDVNQKVNLLRSILKHRRYPTITDTQNRFENMVKSLKLPANVSLTPPAFFEDTAYSLKLDFHDIAELKAHQTTIDRIARHPAAEKILERPPCP